MTEEPEDRELVRLFGVLRKTDDRLAPAFREVLERPRARRRTPVGRLAAAVVLAFALGAAALLLRRTAPPPAPASAGPMLADWKAPTDALLQTPGVDLLDSVPSLASVPLTQRLDSGVPAGETPPASIPTVSKKGVS